MSRSGSTTRDRTRGTGRGASPAAGPRVTRIRPRASRRRRVTVAAAAVLVLLAGAGWLVWLSPVLGVSTVQVDGVQTLTVAEVQQVTGIAEGTPLARVDTDAAAARVADLPQVASAEVTRGWPDRVVVTVVERVPVAFVDTAGTRTLVDATGALFGTITGDPPPGLVPLQVATPGPEDAATGAALAALGSLPASVGDRLVAVAATGPDDVTLVLTDGSTVLWGSAEQAERKAEVLAGVLDQLAAGTIDPAGQIDVSAPEAVVLR